MGEPGWGNAQSSLTEYIGQGTRTGGTETSQYLEGKEINRDSPSSGERTGKSLNQPTQVGWGRGASVIGHGRVVERHGMAGHRR